MKITKKLITLALAAMLLLSLAAPAMADDSDFEIEERFGNKHLVGYNGPGGDVVIPDGVIGFGTTFMNNSSITSVTIPSSVTAITVYAFNGCSNLKSVTIPAYSAAINDRTFLIDNCTFYKCPNLTDIYYAGTEADWKAIEKKAKDSGLMPIFEEGSNVTVHYNSTGPDASATPTPPETPTTPTAPGFTDVAADAWYAEAVKWAVEKNITTGTSATTFSPETTCTTAQILTFLWRACGSPKTEAANGFTDVSASDYYYDAALWAGSKGMVSGDTLSPDTPCTRASTVMFIWQAKDKPTSGSASSFTDVPADADYAAAVAWAVENGVTSGTSATTFSPADTCTRSQIVTFLNRAFAD